MSVLSSSYLLNPFLFFGLSLFGSYHCGAMCGGYALLAQNQGQMLYYHLGRLMTYLSLGIIISSVGVVVLQNEIFNFITGILFLLFFTWTIYKVLRKQHLHFESPVFLTEWRKNIKWNNKNGFVLGVLSTLFPCGWLYVFLFASFQSRHIWMGLYYMWLFWVGTLPIFYIVKRYIGAANNRIMVVLLIFIMSLMTLQLRFKHIQKSKGKSIVSLLCG